jgi:hypothetical protein
VPADGYPLEWSVYRWLKGENATTERVTDLSRLATNLAQFVAALQRIDPTGGPPPGEHNFFRGVPLAARARPIVVGPWRSSALASAQTPPFPRKPAQRRRGSQGARASLIPISSSSQKSGYQDAIGPFGLKRVAAVEQVLDALQEHVACIRLVSTVDNAGLIWRESGRGGEASQG